jgi:tetratricopeptide (TPR) repeat protein
MMPVTNLFCMALLLALLPSQSNPLSDGIAQFQRGEYAKAESSLQLALQMKEDPRARAFLALARAGNGHCDIALRDLETQSSTLADAELRRLTGLGLAQCYLSKDRFADAVRVLAQLKKLYPADPDVLYESARVYMRAWNDTVQEMFQKTPSSFRVNQLSGEVFDTQGNYPEAVEQFKEAIRKNPRALDLHFRAGRSLLMSSHSPEVLSQAQQQFEAELALNPNDAVAEYEIAEILIAEQRPGDARPHLERAVQLNGEFPEALIALAKTKLQAKQNDAAIELLERAVRLNPNSEAAHYSLMLAYRDAGRIRDSLREKAELEKLQRPPEGEFTEFLKKLGDQAPQQ